MIIYDDYHKIQKNSDPPKILCDYMYSKIWKKMWFYV